MNPYWVVVENVPALLDSGAGHILQSALRRMGYSVEARILDPSEYGELTGRRQST
jgi:site-specific DNA-cytosine methylase